MSARNLVLEKANWFLTCLFDSFASGRQRKEEDNYYSGVNFDQKGQTGW